MCDSQCVVPIESVELRGVVFGHLYGVAFFDAFYLAHKVVCLVAEEVERVVEALGFVVSHWNAGKVAAMTLDKVVIVCQSSAFSNEELLPDDTPIDLIARVARVVVGVDVEVVVLYSRADAIRDEVRRSDD